MQIKVLVTNQSAGSIIGKVGSHIGEIMEATGAHVSVSKRSNNPALPERVVTIKGELEQLIRGTVLDDLYSLCAQSMYYAKEPETSE